MGLAFYCVGALCFWPSAKFESFPAFVVSAFVIACGLATLEVCANSYVTVLGSPEKAAFRLNFSQAFNGLASFIGPLIASKAFFSHDDVGKGSLNSVQFVYLGVACLGAAVMVLFFFAKLPEITEQDMADNQANAGYVDERPLWKRKHTVIGFVVQFCYVGAQVSTAVSFPSVHSRFACAISDIGICTQSFIINYLNDSKMYTKSQASQMFSYMQITFMVGRFVSTPLLRFFNDATILAVYGTMCATFSLVAALTGGKPGLASLFIVFFFESVCYPTTFTLATSNLGIWTKRGASLVVMGVGGGAAFPPMQGALADARSTELSYVINAVGFLTVAAYGVGMRLYQRRFAHMVANASLEAAVLPASSSKEKLDDESEKIETPTLHI